MEKSFLGKQQRLGKLLKFNKVFCGAFIFSSLTVMGLAQWMDRDGDGLPDDFEVFFGLDPDRSLDALSDPDQDELIAREEFHRRTDPFSADTDRDGFADGHDDVPVSRAFYDFGNPLFVTGDRAELYDAPMGLGRDPRIRIMEDQSADSASLPSTDSIK